MAVSPLQSVKYFVRISQFEQRSNLGKWVGKNLAVVQIGIRERSVHPVNHCFDAKMKFM